MIPRHLTIAMGILFVASLSMGVYVWRMQKSAAKTEVSAAYTRAVAPPASGPTEQVTLYVADDESGSLHPQTTTIPLPAGRQQRAQELLRALMVLYLDKNSSHPLGPGCDVRDVFLVDPGLAVIDVNSAFAHGHRSGILVEELTVASLVGTLSMNLPGITRVKILVDGKESDSLSGHADLSVFYDVSAVNKLVSEMQSPQ
jgi:hypothetical protein